MVVMSVDVPRCRVGLSLKRLQQDPLTETLDSIQWRETTQVQTLRVVVCGAIVRLLRRVHTRWEHTGYWLMRWRL